MEEERDQRRRAEGIVPQQMRRKLQKQHKAEAKKLREEKRLECMGIGKVTRPANSS